MTDTTLEALAERCEAATMPDQSLHIAILRATDDNGYRVEDDGTILVSGDMGDGPGWFNIGYEVPCYLGMIAPAMSLIPDQFYWIMAKGKTRPKEPLFAIQVLDAESNAIVAQSESDHLEACICAAALRARAALTAAGAPQQ